MLNEIVNISVLSNDQMNLRIRRKNEIIMHAVIDRFAILRKADPSYSFFDGYIEYFVYESQGGHVKLQVS